MERTCALAPSFDTGARAPAGHAALCMHSARLERAPPPSPLSLTLRCPAGGFFAKDMAVLQAAGDALLVPSTRASTTFKRLLVARDAFAVATPAAAGALSQARRCVVSAAGLAGCGVSVVVAAAAGALSQVRPLRGGAARLAGSGGAAALLHQARMKTRRPSLHALSGEINTLACLRRERKAGQRHGCDLIVWAPRIRAKPDPEPRRVVNH